MLVDEGARSDQTALLTVGEQEDHIVAQCRPGLEGAEGFQQRCNTRAVVGGARAGWYRVIVRRDQE
jgi:hypothetical protein